MSEKQYVSDLVDKDSVVSIFLVKEKMVAKGKNGKSYISIVLSDRSGTVDGRIWDNIEECAALFQTGEFIRIKGAVQMFQNRKQVVVHKVERVQSHEFELRDFMGAASEPAEKMFTDLRKIIDEIRDPFIQKLVLDVVEDPEIHSRLLNCPAAKSIHHAYIGGLLEHVLSISRTMMYLANHYPVLNRDLLVFGAIFHDIGKIWELDYESGTIYTDRGRLIGHLVMAAELVDRRAAQIADFPAELKMVLQHIILSHHGKQEYGSPKTPQFLEAFVVAAIDDFDSKVNTISQFMQNERQHGEKWSRYQPSFERYFYLGITPDRAYGSGKQNESALFIPEGHSGLSYKKGSNET